MSHYISVMRPGKPGLPASMTAHERETFREHVAYLREQHTSGRVVFAGPSVEPGEEHFAVVVLEAECKAHAQAIMERDPAVASGLFTSHVTEFEVFLERPLEERPRAPLA
jgi:uncharacterized protein YciI